jgi:hypothetical protein
VRLYDSANLPDELVEMIRLTGARIKVQAPVLEPDRIWAPEDARSLDLPDPGGKYYVALFVSHDRSVGVLHDFVAKTLTVYQGSTWREKANPEGGRIVRVIPEFWQSPTYGGYSVNAAFSPDGRFFLVKWGPRKGALLYDTATWEPVTDPQLFPQNLTDYLPSDDWDMGIAVTNTGELLVWDQQAHRVRSRLPALDNVNGVSFTPDRTRVAVYSGPDDINKLRLNVWETGSGQKLRDFFPVEWISYPSGKPLFWNGGRWLLAPYASQFAGRGVGIWEADTGRFKGTLSVTGRCNKWDGRWEDLVALGPRLFEQCSPGDGKVGEVFEWTIEGVTKRLDSAASHVAAGAASDRK